MNKKAAITRIKQKAVSFSLSRPDREANDALILTMVSFFIRLLKKSSFNAHLKAVQPYVQSGNSHFLEGFRLELSASAEKKKYLVVGSDTTLACTVTFESAAGQVVIGDKTHIGTSRLICRSKIEIEDHVFIAWGCYLYDHDSHSIDYREREKDIERQLDDHRNGRSFIAGKDWSVVNSKPIRICANAWVGMHSIILKGVTIGEGAIIGAGSVVTKNIPAWTIAAGNPAQVVREIPKELRKT